MEHVSLQRRTGTIDYGKLYEQKISALLGVKCALNEDIEDMWMATNVNGLGAFDDLVLFVEYKKIGNKENKNKEIYLIQMKHKQNGNLKLTSGKNDLMKYQESFIKIKNDFLKGTSPLQKCCQFRNVKFLILTNTKIDTSNINLTRYEYTSDIINTGKIFKISNNSSTIYDGDFLSQTFIYYSQVDVMSVENSIKGEIDKYFKNCNIQENIIKCFTEWHLRLVENKEKLKKIHIQSILLEEILSPNILDITATPFGKAEMWNEITEEFKFVFVNNKNNLPKVWQAIQVKIENIFNDESIDVYNEVIQLNSSTLKKVKAGLKCEHLHFRKKKQSYNKRELYLLLWQMCQVPLVLNLNMYTHSFENIRTALLKLDSLSKRRYMFYGQITDNFPQRSIFSNILDAEEYVIDNILDNIYISLQGKEAVTLKMLKPTKDVLKTITPDILIELLERNTDKLEINSLYVSRFIKKTMFLTNVLRLVHTVPDVVFVIVTEDDMHTSLIKLTRFGQITPWYLYELFNKNAAVNNVSKTTPIILIKHIRDLKDFRNIETVINKVRQSKDVTVHYFQYVDEHKLEWLHSNKNVNQIRSYIFNSNERLHDTKLFDRVTFNILSDKAGEGKSTLLHFLAHNCPTDTWVIELNMRDLIQYIDKGEFANIKEFLHKQSNQGIIYSNKFSWELFQNLYQELKILITIDGIDEMEFNMKSEEFFDTVKSLGIKTIFATRPSLKNYLEEKYETFSLSLEPFTNEDRKLLLESILQKYNRFDEIYIGDVLQKLSLWDDIVGAPLLITLFVTLLTANSVPNLDEIDITDLFDFHINNQLQKVCSCTRSTQRTLSRAALFVFYNGSALSELFDIEEYLEDIEDKLPILIKSKLIEKFDTNDAPIFAHKSLAEFLAGKYLASTAGKPCGHKFFKSLFYKELETVRLFFDKIVLKHSPLLKIINNNKIHLEVQTDVVDKFERSCLHIAASYGKRFELRTEESLWSGVKIYESYNKKQSDNSIEPCQMHERKAYVTVDFFCNYLKQGLDPLQKDDLFNMDVFDFAIESGSLEIIDLLLSKNYEKALDSVNCDILLFYAVRYGYVNIFRKLQNKNYNLKITPNFDNLLHIALYGENLDIVSELTDKLNNIDEPNNLGSTPLINWITPSTITVFKNNTFSMTINRKTTFNENQLKIIQHMINKRANLNKINLLGETLLHCACMSNEESFIKILLTNNADVNSKTKMHDIPLHYASKHSLKYVKLLVKHNSEIDVSNNSGCSPLCIAARYNLPDIVQYLIRKKAIVNRNKKQASPLNSAVLTGQEECVTLLIENGARINNGNINNSLVLAVISGNLNCVKILIDKGANVNNDILACAILYNYQDIISFILSQNCNITLDKCMNGISPLFFAVERDNPRLISLLILHGADLNAQNEKGETPLIEASALGLVNIVNQLIENGSTVDAEDRQRYNALTKAAQIGQLECVKVLISNRTNLQKYGPFAMYVAARNGHYQIVDYIMSTQTKHEETNSTVLSTLITNFNGRRPKEPEEISYLNEALILAANDGQLKSIKFLIDKGADLSKYGSRAILNASLQGHITVIDYLISIGASINGTIDDRAAIHAAVSEGNLSAVECLVNRGADINIKTNSQGLTPFMIAALIGRKDIMAYLVKNGAKIDDYNQHSALIMASQEGHLNCVQFLIDRMHVDFSKHGSLVIYFASVQGHVDILNYLISVGVSINGIIDGNFAAIHQVTFEGNLNALKCLFNKGADINLKTVSGSYTPLMIAAFKGHTNIIEYLVKNKTKLDEENNDRYTALTLASLQGQLECVRLLVDKGSRLNKCGSFALYLAARNSHFHVVDYLISVGTNINGIIFNDKPLIHNCILLGDIKLVKYFLSLGALVNLKDREDVTPLMIATSIGRRDIAEYLVEKGATLDEEDDKRNTALILSSRAGHLECVKFLIDRGSDEKKYGLRALFAAAARGHCHIVNYFTQKMTSHSGIISGRVTT